MTALDIPTMRNAMTERLSVFSSLIQDPGWFDPVHEKLCDWAQYQIEKSIVDKRMCKMIIIQPRGSLKSTVVTRNMPIWLSLPKTHGPWKDIDCPSLRNLIAGNTITNAGKKVENIRGIYESHELFRAVFPELIPDGNCKWTNIAAEIPRKRKHGESTFEAAGIKTKKVGTHYESIWEDDTVCPDESDLKVNVLTPSMETIEKAIGWHKGAIPLLTPVPTETIGLSMMVIVTTRWADYDLVNYLMSEQSDWAVFDVPAKKPDGKLLFSIYSEEKLDQLEKDMGPYIFSCLYLNKPLDDSLRTFKKDWIKYVLPEEVPSEGYFSIACDPAISEKDEACETAITRVFHSKKGGKVPIQHWTDAIHGHFSMEETIEQIVSLVKRDVERTRFLFLEQIAYQGAIKKPLMDRLMQENIYIPISATPSRTRKEVKIEGMVPYFAYGKVFLVRGLSTHVETQLIQYPNGRLVDLIDSFSMHLPAIEYQEVLPAAEENKPAYIYNSWDEVLQSVRKAKGKDNFVLPDGLDEIYDHELSTGIALR